MALLAGASCHSITSERGTIVADPHTLRSGNDEPIVARLVESEPPTSHDQSSHAENGIADQGIAGEPIVAALVDDRPRDEASGVATGPRGLCGAMLT